MPYFGALEAGGTKMVCAVVSGQGEIMERTVLPTRCPYPSVRFHPCHAQDGLAGVPHCGVFPGGAGGPGGF